MRKNSVFLKKNYIPHFYYYNFFLKHLNVLKKNYTNKLYSKRFANSVLIHPDFFFSKKIFNFYNNFKFFLNSKNINYLFLQKFNIGTNNWGNNIILFENKNILTKINPDDYKNLFSIKNLFENKEIFTLNLFINYSINLFNYVEIYKIMILLLVYKLK